MNFNTERFVNFAKYDLAINKAFYRNMSLAALLGTIGIAAIGFSGRYMMWKQVALNPFYDGDLDPYSEDGYNWMVFTGCYLFVFLVIMMVIYAGCWAHNLRTKQGRITELTLPANNLEKFVWHIGLMLVGGFLLNVVALLIADALNALLTILIYGTEGGVASLTSTVIDVMNMKQLEVLNTVNVNLPDEANLEYREGVAMTANIAKFFQSLRFVIICGIIFKLFIYMFGNAVKYKYNIILTYITMQVLGIILVILTFVGIAIFGEYIKDFVPKHWDDPLEFLADLRYGFYMKSICDLLLSALLAWWSYKRYTQAQITSPLNK